MRSTEFFPEVMTVNSYHNFGISPEDLSSQFKVISTSVEDHSIESFSHQSLPFFGIMWHPERAPENEEFNLKFIVRVFGE